MRSWARSASACDERLRSPRPYGRRSRRGSIIGAMRLLALTLLCSLSGCVPGCGGESAPAAEAHTPPVRLPSGGGEPPGDEGGPVEARDWAEAPPVEPPPPLPAAAATE
jgi:hypothetical protein